MRKITLEELKTVDKNIPVFIELADGELSVPLSLAYFNETDGYIFKHYVDRDFVMGMQFTMEIMKEYNGVYIDDNSRS